MRFFEWLINVLGISSYNKEYYQDRVPAPEPENMRKSHCYYVHGNGAMHEVRLEEDGPVLKTYIDNHSQYYVIDPETNERVYLIYG